MWTVVYIATNSITAEKIRDKLSQEGVLVTLRAVGASPLGESRSVEVLVPEGEIEEAHEIISETIGK
ncbi:DUF2007 domain-containing protein [Metallumcola ferriviriculae]|uniref:DUF2007 domain-containing protein n=1 Tax=Metallumcola ferriviriculae TaxID=3039180 RepID=A0AAU0USS6_9FIRM|nr:DUF2007 domain-containing protein [Desulfitibacteraceae bacterium MK1]